MNDPRTRHLFHSYRRAFERCGLILTQRVRREADQKVECGEIEVEHETKNRLLAKIILRGRKVRMVYSKKFKTIITFLGGWP